MPRTRTQWQDAVACVTWTAISAAQVFSPGVYSRAGCISGSGHLLTPPRQLVDPYGERDVLNVPCTGVGIDGTCRRDWVVSTFMSRMAPAKTVERHTDAFEDAMLAHGVLRVYRARGLIQTL